MAIGVAEQGDRGSGHCFYIAYGEEQAIDAVVDEFGYSSDAGGDGGCLASHGFEGGEAEGLHLAGHEHEVGEGKEFVNAVLLAEEVDAVVNAEGVGEPFGCGAVGTVSNES